MVGGRHMMRRRLMTGQLGSGKGERRRGTKIKERREAGGGEEGVVRSEGKASGEGWQTGTEEG